MKLSAQIIKSAKSKNKRYRLSDGRGLTISVEPNGRKIWRLAYRVGSKNTTKTLGEFPYVGLREARLVAQEFLLHVKMGEEPNSLSVQPVEQGESVTYSLQRADLSELEPVVVIPTFSDVAAEFLRKRELEGIRPRTRHRIERHIASAAKFVGNTPINEVRATDVLTICRTWVDARKLPSAEHQRTLLSQVFRFAVGLGYIENDPAALVSSAIPKAPRKHLPAITELSRLKWLIKQILAYQGDPIVANALRFALLVYPRPGELRQVRWSEIDLESAVWNAPAETMKMKRPLLVPLSRQVVHMLEAMKALRSRNPYVSHSTRTHSGMLSENTLSKALKTIGVPPSEHVPHGFRSTASTILNENGWNADWIEVSLAHVPSGVRAVYNRAKYVEDRVKMAQWYADYLEHIAQE